MLKIFSDGCGEGVKWNCHADVNYFLVTEYSKVFNRTQTSAICQRFFFINYKLTSCVLYLFTVKFPSQGTHT